jgi:hypothetical protein
MNIMLIESFKAFWLWDVGRLSKSFHCSLPTFQALQYHMLSFDIGIRALLNTETV